MGSEEINFVVSAVNLDARDVINLTLGKNGDEGVLSFEAKSFCHAFRKDYDQEGRNFGIYLHTKDGKSVKRHVEPVDVNIFSQLFEALLRSSVGEKCYSISFEYGIGFFFNTEHAGPTCVIRRRNEGMCSMFIQFCDNKEAFVDGTPTKAVTKEELFAQNMSVHHRILDKRRGSLKDSCANLGAPRKRHRAAKK